MLVSREDPFPLVCLEAASLGKPVLCFADAGGMPEFVEDDAGYVLPYLDTKQMSAQIIELATDVERVKQLGACAQFKVRDKYNIDIGAGRIIEMLQKIYRQNSLSRNNCLRNSLQTTHLLLNTKCSH